MFKILKLLNHIRPASSLPRSYGRLYLKVPLLTTATGLAAISLYSWYHIQDEPQFKERSTSLNPYYFSKYRITNRLECSNSHFLLELTPLNPQYTRLWSSETLNNIWSIEIKQPLLMVSRNYTPLPIKLIEDDQLEVISLTDNYDSKSKSRMSIPVDEDQSRLTLFIKRYEDGEISRWLQSLALNEIIEVRGPFIDYTISSDKNAINFFCAGTGIVTALQTLLLNTIIRSKISKNWNIFYSCNTVSDLGSLKQLLLNLPTSLCKNGDNMNLKIFEDVKTQNISENLSSFVKSIPILSTEGQLSLVCGPDSYIDTIAGKKLDLSQGPLKGILSKKGWSSANVFKLS